jgi:gamma-aminobutyrate permease
MTSVPHELGHGLRTRHVTMITVGGIIGAGLFVGSSTAIATIGPAAILSYMLSGLVILFMMRMLSELASAYPGTGSFTEFARLGLGEWAGFTAGWLYWYFWVAVVPIEAIGGARILHAWIPAIQVWHFGILLLSLMTAVNLLSARSFGEFEFWFASIKVAAIIVFIAIAASYACGLTSPHGATFANLVSHGGFAPKGLLVILAGVTSIIFSFVGAEIVTIAAAESDAGPRAIAQLTSSVALRILVFFVITIALIVSVMPWDEVRPTVSPFAQALERMHIPSAATIMNVVVLTAVLSCLNSGIYVTSRVLFQLAAKGDAPLWLVAVNRRKVPTRAILAGAGFGYLALAWCAFAPDFVFNFLVDTSGAIALVNYLLVALAELRLRRHLETSAPERLTIRMWFFPYATWGTAAFIVGVLVAMAATPDLQSQFFSSLAVVLLVLGLFAVLRRRPIRQPA